MFVLQQGETKSVCELLLHTEGWTRAKGSGEHFQINYHRVVHDEKRAGAWGGGGDLQNVWLWGGELPRLKDSDHQKSTAGQRGKRDSRASLEAWVPLLVGRT